VLKTRARWDTLSMISAISARGEVAFQILAGSFIAFLAAVIDGRKQKVFLIVDNLRVHRAKRVTQWLADKNDRIELVFLPPYAPTSQSRRIPQPGLQERLASRPCQSHHGRVARQGTGLYAAARYHTRSRHGLFQASSGTLRLRMYLRAGLIVAVHPPQARGTGPF
jgi:hypothetical protein